MPLTDRHLRRYLQATGLECHDYAQWVLPIRGDLQLEVGGVGGRVDLLQGAFVAPGETHDMEALGENCCLIIDCHAGVLDDDTLEHLYRQRWLALPSGIRQQLQRIQEEGVESDPLPQLLRYFAPDGSGARLQALCMCIARSPGSDWSVARMSAEVGVSASRLHALFAREFALSPQAWVSAARLRWAKQQLLNSRAAISDIAQRAGYSEQSALTRALRRESGLTPRQWRASGSSFGQDMPQAAS
ncbi:MAG: AraC family transcriptional regulator [Stenotrophomonas sp.]|uniref:helix-turn-helix transcriptional regulator n=1 Tax=Stenotrophomonas sp. TaxID=69392 RepID=UPI003D6D1013